MSWLVLMACKFSIKILSGRKCKKNVEKNEKNVCVQRGNSNWGNNIFVKSQGGY